MKAGLRSITNQHQHAAALLIWRTNVCGLGGIRVRAHSPPDRGERESVCVCRISVSALINQKNGTKNDQQRPSTYHDYLREVDGRSTRAHGKQGTTGRNGHIRVEEDLHL